VLTPFKRIVKELGMDRNSALEREYELELRNGAAPPEEELEDTDNQFMSELGDEEDLARELDSRNGDEEFELDDGLAGDGSYGARFYELSLREGEVEAELEQRIGEVLDDIEREYFFGNSASGPSASARAGSCEAWQARRSSSRRAAFRPCRPSKA
jgi:hypothetical protein